MGWGGTWGDSERGRDQKKKRVYYRINIRHKSRHENIPERKGGKKEHKAFASRSSFAEPSVRG